MRCLAGRKVQTTHQPLTSRESSFAKQLEPPLQVPSFLPSHLSLNFPFLLLYSPSGTSWHTLSSSSAPGIICTHEITTMASSWNASTPTMRSRRSAPASRASQSESHKRGDVSKRNLELWMLTMKSVLIGWLDRGREADMTKVACSAIQAVLRRDQSPTFNCFEIIATILSSISTDTVGIDKNFGHVLHFTP